MISSEAAERFMASNWLTDLDPDSRRAILKVLVEHRAKPKTTLMTQDEPNDRITFLIEGQAIVSRAGAQGQAETLATLQAPALFGLTSFFPEKPPSFSVQATSSVWFLTLDHRAHDQLRREDPRAAEQLALHAARLLADRVKMLDRRITEELVRQPRATEWASFRTQLFEESNL